MRRHNILKMTSLNPSQPPFAKGGAIISLCPPGQRSYGPEAKEGKFLAFARKVRMDLVASAFTISRH